MEDIQVLYHPDFVKVFSHLTLKELMYKLRDRGLCSETGFHIDRVRMNSIRDPLIVFNDFMWTEAELLLYALIAWLHDVKES